MLTARIALLIYLGSIFALATGQPTHAADDASSDRPIVMVCLHGTVKSVMASEYFNNEAKERGLPFRSISRGVDPDAKVPDKIANALATDGFDVSNFEPRRLTPQDAAKSSQLVAIGVDLSDFRSDDPHAAGTENTQ